MTVDLVEVRWVPDAAIDEPARARLATFLDQVELSRARSLTLPAREQFVVRRGVLRLLLGRALRLPPDRVDISTDSNGRPIVGGHLRFSVSGTDGLTAYAVAGGRDIGVDVERIRPLQDLPAMVRRVCTDRECTWLFEQPDAERAFFTLWTAKEAVLKATGHGLTRSPAHVGVEPGRAEFDGRVWTLAPIDVGSGYVATLAVEGAGWALSAGPLHHDPDLIGVLHAERLDGA